MMHKDYLLALCLARPAVYELPSDVLYHSSSDTGAHFAAGSKGKMSLNCNCHMCASHVKQAFT